MLADVLRFLILAAIALAVLGVWLRSRRWRVGRAASVDVLAGILALPRRYMVDLHEVVSRHRFSAVMHAMAAGGFVASTVLVVIVHGLRFTAAWLAWPLLVLLAVMAMGAVLAGVRRWSNKPPRLSGGAFNLLPFALLAFAAGFFAATLEAVGLFALSESIWWLQAIVATFAAWGCLELIVGMAAGPMKHAACGALHLAFHPRPGRFASNTADCALEPLDLEAAKLGAETPADFAWNRLLGFDACVECGLCKEVCPAFAAGLPLNPKKLIQVLATALGEGEATYRCTLRPLPPATGGPDRPLVGRDALIHPDTLWACTTCRACVHECPMMIEHVDAVIELRRFQALELGAVPGKGADALEELRTTDNAAGASPESRLDWAADLDLPVLEDGASCDVLLWLGEGAFDLRNQRTLRAVVKLLGRAGVDFAVLGAAERDCGDLARRLGDEATFRKLARLNIETLAKRRFERIVTADPHVLNCLGNDYPALGGTYTVVSHVALLAGLLESGALTTAPREAGKVTYHDPCYLGRYNGEIEAPRILIRAIGAEPVEMERWGLNSHCCGGGGGAALTDVVGQRRIPDMRMDQARTAGADIVAVACPTCAVMLEGVVRPRPEVADVAELLLGAVEGA